MNARTLALAVALLAALGAPAVAGAQPRTDVRLKELGRIEGWRENSLAGYGLVTGLAGTGDSPRNRATRQSIANLMSQFGVVIPNDQVLSRNVAAVMVMATLPAFASAGSRIDITVNSMGDARSLLGGTLLLAPLQGVDGKVHALAQGPVSIGGYKYDAFGNVVQKNHPTVGVVPGGATVELAVPTRDVGPDGQAVFSLSSPDYTTATRVAESINRAFGPQVARARDAASVEIRVPDAGTDPVAFLMRVENLAIEPDQRARVVINERTGMVISGGDVRISQVTISHGALKVSVATTWGLAQPGFAPHAAAGVPGTHAGTGWGGAGAIPGAGRAVALPQVSVDVEEGAARSVSLRGNSTVADLVQALATIQTSPREMISILQGMKAAGALYAELIIQ